MDINHLFTEAVRLIASDLHLIAGYPPMFRIAGNLVPVEGTQILSGEDITQLVYGTFTDTQKELFLTNKEIDYSIAAAGGRFRTNVYYQKGSIAADFRLIPSNIRSID